MFTGEDPVKAGLVVSLNQPGGNATGVSTLATAIGSKRLGLLSELVLNAKTIAVLNNPNGLDVERHLQDVQSAARSLGQQIRVFNVTDEGEIDAVFQSLARERPDALLVNPDPFMNSRREQIVALANHYKLPAFYQWREYAEAGGLVSTDQATPNLIDWSAFTPAASSMVQGPPICLSSSPRSSSW